MTNTSCTVTGFGIFLFIEWYYGVQRKTGSAQATDRWAVNSNEAEQ